MQKKRNLWYFGLEPLKERYTYQLSEKWMPDTFEDKDITFIPLKIDLDSNEIKNGFVLDSTNRGIYSMAQCQTLLLNIKKGLVKENDIIFLQDFWTPGFESVMYALQLAGIKVKVYSMLHAQSVDEYDFTYQMRDWMRHFELGMDNFHAGIFVGSTIHRDQLKAAGFKSPIHVLGLPIHTGMIDTIIVPKKNQVVFTSRFDKEKNPFFLLEVAEDFLKFNPGWTFVITTSSDSLRSSINEVPEIFRNFAYRQPRFIIKEALSKSEYYHILAESKIQFNCSLQDYVSWTMLEAIYFDCDLVYPDFRSFPELLRPENLYKAFDSNDAVNTLCSHSWRGELELTNISVLEKCNVGRQFEAYIMLNDIEKEFNIWHEYEYIRHLLNEDNRGRRFKQD